MRDIASHQAFHALLRRHRASTRRPHGRAGVRPRAAEPAGSSESAAPRRGGAELRRRGAPAEAGHPGPRVRQVLARRVAPDVPRVDGPGLHGQGALRLRRRDGRDVRRLLRRRRRDVFARGAAPPRARARHGHGRHELRLGEAGAQAARPPRGRALRQGRRRRRRDAPLRPRGISGGRLGRVPRREDLRRRVDGGLRLGRRGLRLFRRRRRARAPEHRRAGRAGPHARRRGLLRHAGQE